MSWRYIAERVRTGQLLDVDLDFTADGPPQRELSGPGSLSGSIALSEDPQDAEDGYPVIDDWSTAIYAEQDGVIAWGGLVTDTKPVADRLTITCTGFVGYPTGMPFLATYGGVALDVFDVVRTIWTHLQSFRAGNLHLVVDTHKAGVSVGTSSEPYGLVWWEAPDCGSELETLAKATPFEFREEHAWNADRTAITHRLRLGYPRLGGRRPDLRFVPGENVVGATDPDRLADEYANEVFGVGKGTGSVSAKASAAVEDQLRVRRVATLTDKRLTRDPLAVLVRRELAHRRQEWQVDTITIRDHTNAPLGSWQLGDDIPVTLDQPWAGVTVIWHRIVTDQIDSRGGVATLGLVRSDAFTT